MKPTITFIGGGNMALAMVSGLLRSGHPPNKLRVADPDAAQRREARLLAEIEVFERNADAVAGAHTVVLAVKPHLIIPVCRELTEAIAEHESVVLSIAAGVTLGTLAESLRGHTRLVRMMPNTPALVGRGACGLYAGPAVSQSDRQHIEELARAFGKAIWVDAEDGLHNITAISGSGPAYFFLFMQHLEACAIELGLSESDAGLLVRETAAGAAAMAETADFSLAELRRQVTSPGGTTQAAIAAFDAAHLDKIIGHAVQAARQRSVELASPKSEND
ncbi:MAG: pyrroline-5-carboxylate reductase [Pseudomonadota bacterium]